MLKAYLIIIIFVTFFSIKYEIRLLEKCLNNFARIFQVILERFCLLQRMNFEYLQISFVKNTMIAKHKYVCIGFEASYIAPLIKSNNFCAIWNLNDGWTFFTLNNFVLYTTVWKKRFASFEEAFVLKYCTQLTELTVARLIAMNI